ncbi:MAG: aldo/keto reductase [Rhodopirellula sp. JB055]|uniref:aldo/keto reductase n=1 Tax=Rhodopirellula sp. JB055 TaxID=3342846 RepID=UPI00370B2802
MGFRDSNLRHDYTAAGTRRSVEDSLQRIGVSSLDIVFIHDLSPQNSDFGDDWLQHFDEAAKGAMPELTKLEKNFPLLDERDISAVIGAPLNGGFLAGRDRFNYSSRIPNPMKKKLAAISAVATKHGIDIKTATLQFAEAPSTVSAKIPGARTSQQVKENVASMKVAIPEAFWRELKSKGLIAQDAPTPVAS